jgi:hypothetical protein
MFSSVSFGYGMDCKKPSINAQVGEETEFYFNCKNTTGVTFGSYKIFPDNDVITSDATVNVTACEAPVGPGELCAITGTFMAEEVGVYTIDFNDEYGGERHYGIFCNNPEKECIEAEVTSTSYQVGDYVESEGGVVFYVQAGKDTLIVALNDAGSLEWSVNLNDVTTSTDLYTGYDNTVAMYNQDGGSPAATACLDYTGGSHTDWYIPALDELGALYATVITVNDTLATLTGIGATQITTSGFSYYWSSSQSVSDPNAALLVDFSSGIQYNVSKDIMFSVRCVRAI